MRMDPIVLGRVAAIDLVQTLLLTLSDMPVVESNEEKSNSSSVPLRYGCCGTNAEDEISCQGGLEYEIVCMFGDMLIGTCLGGND